jgi:FMN phosphatase YigB (HAD superfamily)
MAVRGVLFDMGGTLLHYNPPGASWEAMEKVGARAVYRHLHGLGFTLPPEEDALASAWDHALALWSSLDHQDVKELKTDRQMAIVAEKWGVPALPADVMAALAEAYMTSIQSTVRPLDGAEDTLRALRDSGLRVGLISNTHWPGETHLYDLDRFGLTPYLEHLVFSSDAEAWKPARDVFELGLQGLDLAAEEAVYVGDSLYFDVWGAQQAGLRGVWIEQPHRWLPDGLTVEPDATIAALPDLLDVLEPWR